MVIDAHRRPREHLARGAARHRAIGDHAAPVPEHLKRHERRAARGGGAPADEVRERTDALRASQSLGRDSNDGGGLWAFTHHELDAQVGKGGGAVGEHDREFERDEKRRDGGAHERGEPAAPRGEARRGGVCAEPHSDLREEACDLGRAEVRERVGSGSDVDDKRRMARVAPARGGWAVAAAIASASRARIVRGRSLADDDPHEAGGPHVVQRGDCAHEQTGEEMGEGVDA